MKIFLLLVLLFLLLPSPSYASEATPSSDIKSKLEELKREVASRAAKLKTEVTKKLTNKAYVGSLKSISSSSLTLASEAGPKLVTINQDTVYESKITHPSYGGKTKTKFSQKTLSEEDYLATLGDVDETGVLTAKKIVLLPASRGERTPNTEPKTYIWGQIISASEKLFTIKDGAGKNIAATIPPQFGVETFDVIIATGNANKNEIFVADFVHIVNAILKPTQAPKPKRKP